MLTGCAGIKVVGQAPSGEAAIAEFQTLRPDVVVMDVFLPGMNGIEATRAILRIDSNARIVLLTTFEGEENVRLALEAGAFGYLLKSAARHDLETAIRAVHAGRRFLTTDAASLLAASTGREPLTPRETEVLARMAEGLRNRQIADQLGIGEVTVKWHVQSILQKLGAQDRTHAVVLAIKRGLIHLPGAGR
ncbi:MAG: response regulator transcription factor [Bryobacteraceae bacterium]|nr:response regulator transcription factor [Bryobacteraceae bacterium]